MDVLDLQDFIALFAGISLRAIAALRAKSEIFGHRFDFSLYFDTKHVFRWFAHLFSSILLMFILPEFFLDWVVPNISWLKIEDWSLFGSATVGFIGYDFIKLFERIGRSLLITLGVKKDT